MDNDSFENESSSKKQLLIIGLVIVILVFAVGAFMMLRSSDDKSISTNNSSNTNSQNNTAGMNEAGDLAQSTDTPDSNVYSFEEVAKHNKESDCWTYIDKIVYDLSEYVPDHPGGVEILRACGTDGTSLFKNRKNRSGESIGTGTPHSSSAENLLVEFKIGTLSQ